MSKRFLILVVVGSLPLIAMFSLVNGENETQQKPAATSIKLPAPILKGAISLEEAFVARKSTRGFNSQPLSIEEVSQILWAGQGITRDDTHRAAPSARATYPIELYLLAENVKDLAAGLYKYIPASHSIIKQPDSIRLANIMSDAIGQDWVATSPAVFIIAANFGRTTSKNGDASNKFVYFESGCVAQNIGLEVAALNLGSTVVGGIDDAKLKELLKMPADEKPIVIMPVGKN